MDKYSDCIGIEFISVLGMPPVEFVSVAADLGCRHVGVALQPIVSQPGAFRCGRCGPMRICGAI